MANQSLTRHTVPVVVDLTQLDSGGALFSASGTHGTGVWIPAGAIVTNAFMVVNTAFATDADTIAVQIKSAADTVAAAAPSGAPWSTTGIKGTLVGTPIVGSNASTLDAGTAAIMKDRIAAGMIDIGAASVEVKTVNSAAVGLTGKVTIYIDYIV